MPIPVLRTWFLFPWSHLASALLCFIAGSSIPVSHTCTPNPALHFVLGSHPLTSPFTPNPFHCLSSADPHLTHHSAIDDLQTILSVICTQLLHRPAVQLLVTCGLVFHASLALPTFLHLLCLSAYPISFPPVSFLPYWSLLFTITLFSLILS